MTRPVDIFTVIGRPASGKGTFTAAMNLWGSQRYVPLSVGDLARNEVDRGSAIGIRYKETILGHGEPDETLAETIEKLVFDKLSEALVQGKGAVLDGYPKTVEQCKALDAFIEKNKLQGRVAFVLLEIEEQEAILRMTSRTTCQKCGKIYSAQVLSNQCTELGCDGIVSKRSDHGLKAPEARIKGYDKKIEPVLEYYKNKNSLHKIDTNGTFDVCAEKFREFYLQHQKV